ncbi:MAG: CocE/NonD family hydrolase C-terminal non-catalytic domain-containing protein [Mycobacteriales bacterium]
MTPSPSLPDDARVRVAARSPLLMELAHGVLALILNRADRLNASDADLGHCLLAAFTDTVMSDVPDTDVAATRTDVGPGGLSVLVCDAIVRTRFREDFEGAVPLTHGQPVRLAVDLGPIACRVPVGHQLRSPVASGNLPHVDRNLNTGSPLGPDSVGRVADQQIWHTPARPCHLPLLARGASA